MVELLIVIAIIVIMTAVLLSQKTNKGAIEVQAAARTIAVQLRALQNDALNGKIVSDEIICKSEMVLDKNNNTYQINYYYGACSTGGTQIPGTPVALKKSTLQTTGTISFLTPEGKVTVSLGANKGFLLVSTSDITQKMTICVDNAGNVEEKKGDVVSSCT